jgi:hypothetical protein
LENLQISFSEYVAEPMYRQALVEIDCLFRPRDPRLDRSKPANPFAKH